MRTTIDLDEGLLAEAAEVTGETSRSKVVKKALEDLVRQARIKELLSLRGKLDLDLDWYEIRHRER